MDIIYSFQNHDISKLNVDNPLLLNAVILVVFAILLYAPSRRTTDRQLLSRSFTDAIRGIAILIIILFHLSRHTVSNPAELLLYSDLGYVGVAIFLFLSGYGLAESARKRGLQSFFEERLSRVYIPFVFLNVVILVLDFFLLENYPGHTYTALCLVGIIPVFGNYWFIPFLIFWYVVFYLANSSRISDAGGYIIYICAAFIVLMSDFFHDLARANALSFPLGIAFSLYWSRISVLYERAKGNRSIVLIALLGGAIFLRIAGNLVTDDPSSTYVYIFDKSLLVVYASVFIYLFLFVKNKKRQIKFFSAATFLLVALGLNGLRIVPKYLITSFSSVSAICLILIFGRLLIKDRVPYFYEHLGKRSLELFLIHGVFMYKYDFILYKLPLHYSFFIYFLCLLILSELLSKLFGRMNRFIMIYARAKN